MWSCKLVRWYSDAFTCLWLFKLMLELFVLLHTGVNWPLWDIINLPINRLTKASGLLDAMLNPIKAQLLFWNGEVTVAPSSECRPPAEGAGGRFAPTLLLLRLGSCRVPFSPTLLSANLACLQLLEPDRMLSRLSSCLSAAVLTYVTGSSELELAEVRVCPPAAVFLHWRWQRLLPMGFASFTYESEAKNGEWWSSLGLRVWVGESGSAEVPARVDDESQLLRSHCCKHVYTFPACEAKRLHKLSWKTRGHSCSLQKAIALKVRPADTTSGTTPLCVHAPHSTALTRLHVTAQQKNTVWTELVSETWNTSVCTQRGWSAAPV